MFLMDKLSDYLKDYFKDNNISQYVIEKKTGIKQSKLSLSLNCKRKFTADELLIIAKSFEIDLNKIKETIK